MGGCTKPLATKTKKDGGDGLDETRVGFLLFCFLCCFCFLLFCLINFLVFLVLLFQLYVKNLD